MIYKTFFSVLSRPISPYLVLDRTEKYHSNNNPVDSSIGFFVGNQRTDRKKYTWAAWNDILSFVADYRSRPLHAIRPARPNPTRTQAPQERANDYRQKRAVHPRGVATGQDPRPRQRRRWHPPRVGGSGKK